MKRLMIAATIAAVSAAPAAAQYLDAVSLVASIGGEEFHDAAAKLSASGTVRVVPISTVPGALHSADRLDRALSLKADDLEYLHAILVVNAPARIALRGAGLDVWDVVTAADAGDSVILYVDDL